MRWLALVLLTACKDGSDKDTIGDVVDETDLDTDAVIDSSDSDTVPPDTDETEDPVLDTARVEDTDDTDVPAPATPAEGFGVASGAADLQSPSFNLKVTVGDPLITHERTSPGYRLEIGVGTLWNTGGTP